MISGEVTVAAKLAEKSKLTARKICCRLLGSSQKLDDRGRRPPLTGARPVSLNTKNGSREMNNLNYDINHLILIASRIPWIELGRAPASDAELSFPSLLPNLFSPDESIANRAFSWVLIILFSRDHFMNRPFMQFQSF